MEESDRTSLRVRFATHRLLPLLPEKVGLSLRVEMAIHEFSNRVVMGLPRRPDAFGPRPGSLHVFVHRVGERNVKHGRQIVQPLGRSEVRQSSTDRDRCLW